MQNRAHDPTGKAHAASCGELTMKREIPNIPPEKLAETALRLLAWAQVFCGKTTAKDVFLWQSKGRYYFALSGVPQGLKRALRMGYDTDYEPMYTKYPINRSRHMIRTLDQAFLANDEFAYEDAAIHIGQVIDIIQSYVAMFLGVGTEWVEFTLIPEPGYPWRPEGITYFSAKKKKVIQAARPDWLSGRTFEIDGVQWPTVNWCKLAEHIARTPKWNSAIYTNYRKTKIYFTHSFSLSDTKPTRDEKAIAQSIVDCRGLLFPSVAIGTIPGPQYLPCCLVLDPTVVLGQITKQHPLVQVYSTDAWTETTDKITGEFAMAAYAQLTGQSIVDYEKSYWDEFYVMGLPQETPNTGFRTDFGMLRTRAEIAARAARRNGVWPEKLTKDIRTFQRAFEKNREYLETGPNPNSYPYLEAKVSGIVDFSCVRTVCVPDYHAERYEFFLRQCGYKGSFVVIETTEAERQAFSEGRAERLENAFARFGYAWKINRALNAL